MPQDGAGTGAAAGPRVRPRLAASLVLLRERDGAIEVLLGRRGLGHRFMPGLFVFPGGRITRADARPWHGEEEAPSAGDDRALRRLARVALRETWEETGLVLGRGGAAPERPAVASPIETAYARQGLHPALDLLTLIGRAITPTLSPIRFDTRFFLADGRHAKGALGTGEELEDVAWHPVSAELPSPMPNVTRFMLQQAVEAWHGRMSPEIPFWKHYRNHVIVARLPRTNRP